MKKLVTVVMLECALWMGCTPSNGEGTDAGVTPPDAGPADAGNTEPDAGSSVPEPVRWALGGNLTVPRFNFSLVKLDNGDLWAVGGENQASAQLQATEARDAVTGMFTAGPDLTESRSMPAATVLADGRVLVTGGGRHDDSGMPSGEDVRASSDLLDPVARTVTAGPVMPEPRSHHHAQRLADGRVLLLGGATTALPNNPGAGVALASTLLFHPDRNTFTSGPALAQARFLHATVQLLDGRVLTVGGLGGSTVRASTEIFDPATNTWSTAASMRTPRFRHQAVVLPSGNVLVVGGTGNLGFLATTEIYNPTTDAWTDGPPLLSGTNSVEMVVLGSGRVLRAGGYEWNQLEGGTDLDESSLWGEANQSWENIAALGTGRWGHRLALLNNGDALVVGGARSTLLGLQAIGACELSSTTP